MFEAILTLCLAARPEICRARLIPGYEAAAEADCAAALAAAAPPEVPSGLAAPGPPRCLAAGETPAFEEVAPGVFVHRGQVAEPDAANRGDVSNIGFVIGQDSVAVIDAGAARWMGEAVWRAIRARSALPVSHVILTHMHPDHVMGAAVFAEAGAVVAGHAGLGRALADRRANYLESFARLIGPQTFIGTEVPRVTLAVKKQAQVDLGGRVLELRAWPPAHTGTDLTIADSASGVMFAGDLLFDAHCPALDGSLPGWQAVLQQMKALPVARVVPGHGAAVLDWPAAAAPLESYLGVLAADTRAAIAAGTRLGEAAGRIAQSETGQWQLCDTFTPRNATQAYTELEWE